MGTYKGHRARLRRRLAIVAVASVLVTIAGIGTAVAIDRQLTMGRVPSGAFDSDGTVDAKQIPDFVPALGRDGNIAGYMPREALGIFNGIVDDEVIPVYAADLTTVVGHMVAGTGFVPLGVDADALPTFAVTTSASQVPGPPVK